MTEILEKYKKIVSKVWWFNQKILKQITFLKNWLLINMWKLCKKIVNQIIGIVIAANIIGVKMRYHMNNQFVL